MQKNDLGHDILQEGAEYRQQEDESAAVLVGEDAKRYGDDKARQAVERVEQLCDGRELGLDRAGGAVGLACGGRRKVPAADDAFQDFRLGRLLEGAGEIHEDHHDEGRGDNAALVGRVSVTAAAAGTQQRSLLAVGARHVGVRVEWRQTCTCELSRRCSYFIFVVARRIWHPLVAGQARYGRWTKSLVGTPGCLKSPRVSHASHPLPCRISVPTAA